MILSSTWNNEEILLVDGVWLFRVFRTAFKRYYFPSITPTGIIARRNCRKKTEEENKRWIRNKVRSRNKNCKCRKWFTDKERRTSHIANMHMVHAYAAHRKNSEEKPKKKATWKPKKIEYRERINDYAGVLRIDDVSKLKAVELCLGDYK